MSRPEARATGPTTAHSIACSRVSVPTPRVRASTSASPVNTGTTALPSTRFQFVEHGQVGSRFGDVAQHAPMQFMP